ncbi:hypothetical protein M413DRAFT_22998 [Hebeloma cylindrosporum]|uniref:Uncharacterized protein n=1 Tax=Hebeloma cylindrosporum TaxID=76867 RepID=A0A0C2Z097_HEBCY|nr:hypothetical protein M413DRAFT_22998 [Hebeloma cylindrosporum h7]
MSSGATSSTAVEGINEAAGKERTDGWIWSFKAQPQMSDKELEEWIDEGDRVQWFRAEAEMQRWQEEWEIKQADFLRCICMFSTMSDVWQALGKDNIKGKAAYAKKKSAMFKAMENEARSKLSKAGHGNLPDLLVPGNRKILADYVEEERLKYVIPELM